MKSFLRGAFIAFFIAACGGAPPAATEGEAGERSLSEMRALQVIREAATDSQVRVSAGFSAELPGGVVDVDYRLGEAFGVEWVSPQDRASAFPAPAEGGQLRILAEPGGTQILILHSESYRYAPRRSQVQAGAASAADVEARLRRDLRDFFVYAGLGEG